LATIRPHIPAVLILLFLTIVTFIDIPTHSFLVIWDDPEYITANPHIRELSWKSVSTAFTHTYAANYAPLQIISYMIDFRIWGLQPFGFLVTNVILHMLAALSIYALLVRLGTERIAALFGAAIFLVHPVQIESVLWISQRKSVLAMLFFLLAFHSYLAYREQGQRSRLAWYGASLILYLISALSKSVVVIFPFVLILYDHLYNHDPRRLREHLDKVPFLVVSLLIGAVTVLIQVPESVGGRTGYPADFALAYPLTMLPVLADYIRLILWPTPSQLSLIYTVPWIRVVDGRFLIAAGIAVILAIIAFGLYRKSRRLFFWYCLFFVGLLPVSQIIPLVTKMNDRYLYFPMIGIAALCAFAAGALLVRLRSGIATVAATSCLIGIIAILGVASYQRSLVWRSTVTLFKDATSKAPALFIPWVGLAAGYRAEGDIKSALYCIDIASRYGYLDPIDSFAIARIYLDRGDPEKAYGFIWGGILKSPSKEGVLLLGIYHNKTGNLDAAEIQLLKYLDSSVNSTEGLLELGRVYLMKGDMPKAGFYAEKAIAADVNLPDPYIITACVAASEGELSRSIQLLDRAAEKGFSDWQQIRDMKCLAGALRDPRFKKLYPGQ
jgi:hypothetical protein